MKKNELSGLRRMKGHLRSACKIVAESVIEYYLPYLCEDGKIVGLLLTWILK
jgi:hypothetical protein